MTDPATTSPDVAMIGLPAGTTGDAPRARLRPGTLSAAVAPTRRAMEWLPLAIAFTLAAALLVHGVTTRPHLPAAAHQLALQIGMAVLAAGSGFALDDTAAASLSHAAAGHGRRRFLRVSLAAAAWAVAWALLLGLAATAGGGLPAAQLTLEAVAWLAISLAVASCFGGAATGAAVLVAFIGVRLLPARVSLLGPIGEGWTAVQGRWAALLAAGVLVVVWTSRDPARRRRGGGHRTPAS